MCSSKAIGTEEKNDGGAGAPDIPRIHFFDALDLIRTGGYGLAFSLVLLELTKKDLNPVSLLAAVFVFLYLSFDGLLRFTVRDDFFKRNPGKSAVTTACVLLFLFTVEMAGMFFFSGWAAFFVVGNHISQSAYFLMGWFCGLAALHNLVFLIVMEYRSKDGNKSAFHRLIFTVPVYLWNTIIADARESKLLPSYLWINRFKAIEDTVVGKMKDDSSSKWKSGFCRQCLRALFHAILQLCACHLIGFNSFFAVLCLLIAQDTTFSKNSTYLWIHTNWILVVVFLALSGFFYFLTSKFEMAREKKTNENLATQKRNRREFNTQMLGNLALITVIVLFVLRLKVACTVYCALAMQSLIMSFMLADMIFMKKEQDKEKQVILECDHVKLFLKNGEACILQPNSVPADVQTESSPILVIQDEGENLTKPT